MVWAGLARVNQILENKFYTKLGKVNGRIPILQQLDPGGKSKNTRYESRDMVLNQAQD